MKFIATTCLISETHKPRPRQHILDFIASNEMVFTPATLIDIERGILRVTQTNPAKAAALREWFAQERARRVILTGRARETSKMLAAILECRHLKYIWLPDPKSKHPSYGVHAATAAAAIVHELPIAAAGIKAYLAINEYFSIPGIYDVTSDRWCQAEYLKAKVKRLRPTDRVNYLSAA
ncbi:PIN domain-containing protein [Mesorhizobium xinjiangense]|uniref:hypothetical protein n=1 Tax=Mesorhizobium xinjiangense TaxID=2678685 RepID=UPI0012EE5C8A|nr:hypothetical protein [Mesorhizobium xinjiangense]